MRVVVVTGEYPPDIGGTATHAADLVANLPGRGIDVTVLGLQDGPRTVREPNVVRYPRGWPWLLRFARVGLWLAANRNRYAAVYALGVHPAAVAAGRVARRPVVVYLPGDHAWERSRRLGLTALSLEDFQTAADLPLRARTMRWLARWSARHSTAVVTPSRFMRSIARRWVPDRVGVITIPSSVAPPEGLPAKPPRPHPGLRAVYVGRLIPLKRVAVLIEAVARCDAVTLDVIGDGPDLEPLRRAAERSRRPGSISFHGRLDHPTTLARIAEADVLLLASETETLSFVAAEALACGTPVVAPRVGGLPELVEHEHNGILVEAVDPETYCSALERLREDPDLLTRLSDEARAPHASAADAVATVLREVTEGP